MSSVSTTGQAIVTQALTVLGINQQGATPGTSDSNSALLELNNAWDAMQIDDGLVWAIQPTSLSTTGGTAVVSLATPPARVYDAFFIQNSVRYELKIVSQDDYRRHRDLAATTVTAPEEVYFDFLLLVGNTPPSAFMWPVPASNGLLEINAPVPFPAWTLGGAYQIPAGWFDDLSYIVAYRLISQFGEIVASSAQQRIAELAMKSEARIRQVNIANRKLQPPEALNPLVQQQAETPRQGA